MKTDKTFLIRSGSFPVLPGEAEELINPGTYGKALAKFLEEELERCGHSFSFIVCEDFGWWLEFANLPFHLGIICSRSPNEGEENLFSCGLSRDAGRMWSWKKFWFVDTTKEIEQIASDLRKVLMDHDDITILP